MNEDRKQKLLNQKQKIENRIKTDEAKLKLINQELSNIEIKEKSDSMDEVLNGLKSQGIDNIDKLLQYVKDGKIVIK